MNIDEITNKARNEVGLLEGIYKPYNPAQQWKLIVKRALEIQKEEFLRDLYEINNNLHDDLKLDLINGEEGCKTYKDSWNAIWKYSMKVVINKVMKYSQNINKANNLTDDPKDREDIE